MYSGLLVTRTLRALVLNASYVPECRFAPYFPVASPVAPLGFSDGNHQTNYRCDDAA